MNKTLRVLVWGSIALVGALALGMVALHRGEPINALWLVAAATCCYALGYRFYSAFIAAKILAVDPLRATPAERLENGRDFLVTNKWVVFGHHFAAIAGPGPLVGPVLAAQFGYLPGTLWIIAGAVFAGCVQDFVILLFSVRRDGKSLGQMAKEEIGPLGGFVAYVAVIAIMIILLAVMALVVVNALKDSPWGTFTIAMTIPIALLMGIYLRRIASREGAGSLDPGIYSRAAGDLGRAMGGAESPELAPDFTLPRTDACDPHSDLRFAASALPVWLLLAPRDYLSTFVKLGTICLLAIGISCCVPRCTCLRSPVSSMAPGRCSPERFFPLLHHHRLRRDLRLPLADFQRHHSQTDRPRDSDCHDGLWRDDGGVGGSGHGHYRGMCAAAGRLFRHEQSGRDCGTDCRRGHHNHLKLGVSGDSARHAVVGQRRRRAHTFQSHRRRSFLCRGHGAYFFAKLGRRHCDGALVSLRRDV